MTNVAENNAAFLMNALPRMIPLNTPDGTTYSAGKKLRFTTPIVPGWLRKIRLRLDLAIACAAGTGTVAASIAILQNAIQNVKVLYGGQELRNCHPYFYGVLKRTMEHDGGFWTNGGAVTQDYSAALLNASVTLDDDGSVTLKSIIDIPLQLDPSNTLGLLPMGAAAQPITVEVDCASAAGGTDPLLNAVITSGNATATITGTVTAVGSYLYGQSTHDPRFAVPTPVIGHFAKIVQQETPITSNTSLTLADLREPYPLLKAMQLVVVPGAADFSAASDLKGAAFDLDPSTRMLDYTAQGAGFDNLLIDQRDAYGQDLDPGVVVWDFIKGSDPKHPDGTDSVNLALYNAARAGVQFGGTLAAASNRLVTASMIVIPVPF